MGTNLGVSCLGRNLFRPHFSCATLGLSLLICIMGLRIGLTSWGEGSSHLKPVRCREQCPGRRKCHVSVRGSEYALTFPTSFPKPKQPRERRIGHLAVFSEGGVNGSADHESPQVGLSGC